MIAIIGESGAGKSSVEKELESTFLFNRIITYTTRPKRENEQNHIDYHFINDTTFSNMVTNNLFAETTVYRGWSYGTAKEDCKDNSVIVIDPHGLRQLKRNTDIDIVSFYIKVPRKDRIIKMLQRGDDIEECYRRSLSDVGLFTGIEDEVDYVIDNIGYKYSVKDISAIIVLDLKKRKLKLK